MENPVCGASTRADGLPESDMITVNGVPKGRHVRVSSNMTCGEREMPILIEGIIILCCYNVWACLKRVRMLMRLAYTPYLWAHENEEV